MRRLIRYFITTFDKPPFQIGDIVRFEPNERALGWTQNLHGLYPGYVGEVTSLIKGSSLFDWGVYVDNKPIEFASCFFHLVRRASPSNETH
jgi:hypothetical protein